MRSGLRVQSQLGKYGSRKAVVQPADSLFQRALKRRFFRGRRPRFQDDRKTKTKLNKLPENSVNKFRV